MEKTSGLLFVSFLISSSMHPDVALAEDSCHALVPPGISQRLEEQQFQLDSLGYIEDDQSASRPEFVLNKVNSVLKEHVASVLVVFLDPEEYYPLLPIPLRTTPQN